MVIIFYSSFLKKLYLATVKIDTIHNIGSAALSFSFFSYQILIFVLISVWINCLVEECNMNCQIWKRSLTYEIWSSPKKGWKKIKYFSGMYLSWSWVVNYRVSALKQLQVILLYMSCLVPFPSAYDLFLYITFILRLLIESHVLTWYMWKSSSAMRML